MPSRTSFEFLPPGRRILLSGLKRLGSASVEELAAEVALSPAATRQQLRALTLQDLVQYNEVREGPGRPRHVYSLTPTSDAIFPQAYNEALDILLTAIGEEDSETRARILRRARDASYERYLSQLRSNDPAGRLDEVRAAFERGGYQPGVSWTEAGHAEFSLLHCPLARLVERSQGACEAEFESLRRALPGSVVERTEFRPAAGIRCSYQITFAHPGPADPSGPDASQRTEPPSR